MTISLICAAAQNGVIGLDNQLPWRLPADLRRFKSLTMHHSVVMGRKTHESIGRPLPGRTNIVITRQPNYRMEGCLIVFSLEEALGIAKNDNEIFIIGGATIYQQALELADRIYLTRIHHDFAGDTYLFDIDRTIWHEITKQEFEPDETNRYRYTFYTLERVSRCK